VRIFFDVLLSVILSLLLTLIMAAAQIIAAIFHLIAAMLPFLFKIIVVLAVVGLLAWLFFRFDSERPTAPRDGNGAAQVRLLTENNG
jgi:membrane protein implicated in regulation of membrane protease activity